MIGKREAHISVKSAILATICVFALILKAEAETLTMACKFQSQTTVGTAGINFFPINRIDQIITRVSTTSIA
jgi:hypothetical protein